MAAKLRKRSGLPVSPDRVPITSGSNQGLDLVNGMFLCPGDTVLVEQFSYGGALARLRRLGARPVGIPLDGGGMRMDLLAEKLAALAEEGVRPKFIYVIPTIQNPGGSIMPEARRAELLRLSAAYGVPVFEDECYADLLWTGARPPAIAALDEGNRVIHCGSFSKTVAPALRVGYIAAEPGLIARMAACKTDGGAGAEFAPTEGGIFLWISFPEAVDAMKLAAASAAAGIAVNPGPEWSADAEPARSRIRLCFGNPTVEEIRGGVEKLADIRRREFGIPLRSGNIERARPRRQGRPEPPSSLSTRAARRRSWAARRPMRARCAWAAR